MIFSISVCGQIFIVQQGGTAFQTVPLDIHLWFTSVMIGLISIPIGILIRSVPDEILAIDKQRKPDNTIEQQHKEPVTYETSEKENSEPNQDNIHWSIKIV